MHMLFYDIESLPGIFSLCAYNEKTDIMDVYYLIDKNWSRLTSEQEREISQEIYKKNKNFTGKIQLLNLLDMAANIKLATDFGFHNPNLNTKFPLINDINANFDEELHPYISGYNSLNYDMVMLAMYFSEVFLQGNYSDTVPHLPNSGPNKPEVFIPTTAALMRTYNDELFSSYFKPCMTSRLQYVYTVNPAEQKMFSTYHIGNKYLKYEGWNTTNPALPIYKNMVSTGRHIDIARLNEKQSKVALKRLLGMLGCQILEPQMDLSNKGEQHDMTFQELKDLFAYNVSDVVNLRELRDQKIYIATFTLKKQLLLDYPELIYNNNGDYKPDMKTVRRDRLTINSTSAQFATNCLCPYGSLQDADEVSFSYPAKKKAEELGISQTNVLQDTIEFINTKLKPLVKSDRGQDIINSLEKMISMYSEIEYKDFNKSHEEEGIEIKDIWSFADRINVPYMGPDGEPTAYYVTFSIGGIHGAEYNKEKYEQDLAYFEQQQALYQKVREKYGDALACIQEMKPNGKIAKRKTVEIDGVTYPLSNFIKSSSTLKKAEYKSEFTNPKKPELFNKKDNKLNKKYVMTSFGLMNHEDFTSYYPSMLIALMAFENPGLGYDRYAEIFGNKEKFGKLMKDESIPKEERELYKNMREGTKLILNSASGAADTNHNSSIRMNNRIISMRIIGQLFAWRIGQAQALAGAKVPSTNTDGLYTILDEETNNRVLKEVAAATNVQIEPELTYLVSKDANNRFEGEIVGHTGDSRLDIKVTGASGGTLACRTGPNPAKSLNHPAILDWALTEFLKWKALSNNMDDYVPEMGLRLLKDIAPYEFKDRKKYLIMFQNVIASSISKGCYNFATLEPVTAENQDTIKPIFMQHYNRVFYVDINKVPECEKHRIRYLCAAYPRINDESDASPLAIHVIRDLNNDRDALRTGTPKLKKINGIEVSTPCMIVNEAIDESDFDPQWLDFDYYNKVLASSYRKSWQNNVDHSNDDDDDE